MYLPLSKRPNLALLRRDKIYIISKEEHRKKGPYFLGPSILIMIAERARAARSRGGASAMSQNYILFIYKVYPWSYLNPSWMIHPVGLCMNSKGVFMRPW